MRLINLKHHLDTISGMHSVFACLLNFKSSAMKLFFFLFALGVAKPISQDEEKVFSPKNSRYVEAVKLSGIIGNPFNNSPSQS